MRLRTEVIPDTNVRTIIQKTLCRFKDTDHEASMLMMNNAPDTAVIDVSGSAGSGM